VNSEDRIRAMFRAFRVGIAQADSPAFSLPRVNQKFLDIAGYSKREC